MNVGAHFRGGIGRCTRLRGSDTRLVFGRGSTGARCAELSHRVSHLPGHHSLHRQPVEQLLAIASTGTLTLLYASRDSEHSSTTVLAAYLAERQIVNTSVPGTKGIHNWEG